MIILNKKTGEKIDSIKAGDMRDSQKVIFDKHSDSDNERDSRAYQLEIEIKQAWYDYEHLECGGLQEQMELIISLERELAVLEYRQELGL